MIAEVKLPKGSIDGEVTELYDEERQGELDRSFAHGRTGILYQNAGQDQGRANNHARWRGQPSEIHASESGLDRYQDGSRGRIRV